MNRIANLLDCSERTFAPRAFLRGVVDGMGFQPGPDQPTTEERHCELFEQRERELHCREAHDSWADGYALTRQARALGDEAAEIFRGFKASPFVGVAGGFTREIAGNSIEVFALEGRVWVYVVAVRDGSTLKSDAANNAAELVDLLTDAVSFCEG